MKSERNCSDGCDDRLVRSNLLSARIPFCNAAKASQTMRLHSASEYRVDGLQMARTFSNNATAGLSDAPRSGPPRLISDDRVDEVITRSLTSRPKNVTHWSTREMAAETELSQSAIFQIWNTLGLQPHRCEAFKVSSAPLFVEKTHDIVGFYMRPPPRTRHRPLRRREVSGSSLGPYPTDLPDASGDSRASNP